MLEAEPPNSNENQEHAVQIDWLTKSGLSWIFVNAFVKVEA